MGGLPIFTGTLLGVSLCSHVDLPNAEALSTGSGVSLCFKVDGRLTRQGKARHSSRGVKEVIIGDVEFADDTTLMGPVEELAAAEEIFVEIVRDWDQQNMASVRSSF